MCFFFSSRRRHTRFDCDWSSDVCSSDLRAGLTLRPDHRRTLADAPERLAQVARAAHERDAESELVDVRSEEHTSELQSQSNLVCRLLLEKKKKNNNNILYAQQTTASVTR